MAHGVGELLIRRETRDYSSAAAAAPKPPPLPLPLVLLLSRYVPGVCAGDASRRRGLVLVRWPWWPPHCPPPRLPPLPGENPGAVSLWGLEARPGCFLVLGWYYLVVLEVYLVNLLGLV